MRTSRGSCAPSCGARAAARGSCGGPIARASSRATSPPRARLRRGWPRPGGACRPRTRAAPGRTGCGGASRRPSGAARRAATAAPWCAAEPAQVETRSQFVLDAENESQLASGLGRAPGPASQAPEGTPRSSMSPLMSLPALIAASLPLSPAQDPAPATVERHLVSMGTDLALEVTAPTRDQALAASEAAVRAIEAVEARLSTWRDDSELARLNAAPAGQPFALSPELERDLEQARDLWRATDGLFDPGVGALVRAFGLRAGGRTPSEEELARAKAAGGF